jgi:hypothetical protein
MYPLHGSRLADARHSTENASSISRVRETRKEIMKSAVMTTTFCELTPSLAGGQCKLLVNIASLLYAPCSVVDTPSNTFNFCFIYFV